MWHKTKNIKTAYDNMLKTNFPLAGQSGVRAKNKEPRDQLADKAAHLKTHFYRCCAMSEGNCVL